MKKKKIRLVDFVKLCLQTYIVIVPLSNEGIPRLKNILYQGEARNTPMMYARREVSEIESNAFVGDNGKKLNGLLVYLEPIQ